MGGRLDTVLGVGFNRSYWREILKVAFVSLGFDCDV